MVSATSFQLHVQNWQIGVKWITLTQMLLVSDRELNSISVCNDKISVCMCLIVSDHHLADAGVLSWIIVWKICDFRAFITVQPGCNSIPPIEYSSLQFTHHPGSRNLWQHLHLAQVRLFPLFSLLIYLIIHAHVCE